MNNATTPDHIAFTSRALDDLILRARSERDWFHKQQFLRRIDQGVEGMVYPLHCARASVLAVADEARQLFKAVVNDPTDIPTATKLRDILGIEPGHQGALDWRPAATQPAQEVAA
jgi:hypothetical protein